MQPALFDTSVYISALRQRSDTGQSLRSIADGAPLWLSAVVLEELLAGTSERDRHIIERLERDFDRATRILVPNQSDWVQTGNFLTQLAIKHHYEKIGQGRLTNDALIATSAGRLGVRVLTANERDFRRLAEFCHFQWQVAEI